MDVLADENADTEWIHVLRDDEHDVQRVVDVDGLGVGAPDRDVLAVAKRTERTLLTGDQSDFHDPPTDDHSGIVIVADVTRSGGELRRALQRIERTYPELAGKVAYVSDWI